MIDGERREVPVQFVLADGSVSFHLGGYDRTQPLVIDPVLDYSTFLGNASVYVNGSCCGRRRRHVHHRRSPSSLSSYAESGDVPQLRQWDE